MRQRLQVYRRSKVTRSHPSHIDKPSKNPRNCTRFEIEKKITEHETNKVWNVYFALLARLVKEKLRENDELDIKE